MRDHRFQKRGFVTEVVGNNTGIGRSAFPCNLADRYAVQAMLGNQRFSTFNQC